MGSVWMTVNLLDTFAPRSLIVNQKIRMSNIYLSDEGLLCIQGTKWGILYALCTKFIDASFVFPKDALKWMIGARDRRFQYLRRHHMAQLLESSSSDICIIYAVAEMKKCLQLNCLMNYLIPDLVGLVQDYYW